VLTHAPTLGMTDSSANVFVNASGACYFFIIRAGDNLSKTAGRERVENHFAGAGDAIRLHPISIESSI
jgi:hypothetical protein